MTGQEQMMREIMQALERTLPGCGIVLLTFPPDAVGGHRVNYISNVLREDMTAALREVLERWEGRRPDAPAARQ